MISPQVLAVLRLLGRGNYFDDVSEFTGMGEATVNHMFHQFTERFAREFYPIWVSTPGVEELKDIMKAYDEVGMTGAMGSVDAMHIEWTLCPFNQRPSYIGKEAYPTVAYNVVVSHDLRVMSCTRGFPGALNDDHRQVRQVCQHDSQRVVQGRRVHSEGQGRGGCAGKRAMVDRGRRIPLRECIHS